jgi:AraC-like DNA-binding protein
MASASAAAGDRDRTRLTDYLILNPSQPALAKLRRLHEVVGTLAEDTPSVVAHPETARSLEQAFLASIMDCLSTGEPQEDQASRRQHAVIMRRFHVALERHLDQALYVPELCKEIGASARTLLACCQEHLGMGPKHYLLLRRMHFVRRALRESSRPDTTVTEIATRYGFWQFGRFAVEYKALFGESPSTTLARPI